MQNEVLPANKLSRTQPHRFQRWLTIGAAALAAGCVGLDQSGGAHHQAGTFDTRSESGASHALFDGVSLNGWRGDPALWSVQDRAITGATPVALPENTFLIHDREYADFVIKLKYRFSTTKGNSGLQYRSKIDSERPYSVIGFQANVVTQDADRSFAMLWEERGRELLARCGERVVVVASPDPATKGFERNVSGTLADCEVIKSSVRPYPEWNEYVIVAYKTRLVHVLNGRVTIDITDEDADRHAKSGFFALQIHRGVPMRVQFKDLTVRMLASPPRWEAEYGVPDST